MGTFWTSGPETNVQLLLPMDATIPVSQLSLHWNCKTLPSGLQLGPASDYHIKARDVISGAYYDVPFTREPRAPGGSEINRSSQPIQTDQLMLVLTAHEPTVQMYSLREVTVANGAGAIAFRLPAARYTSPWLGNPSIFQAFDGAPETAWVSYTQGAVGAVNVVGNNLKFSRLKIFGFGTRAGKECFPFFVFNPYSTPKLGNIVVEDCLFTQPTTNSGESVVVVLVTGAFGSLTNAVVRRCTVRGIGSHFPHGSHAFCAIHVENCMVDDCGEGVYFEPDFNIDYLGPIMVRSNLFVNVDQGLLLRFHAGRQFGPITFIGNEIVLARRGGWAFSACDACGPGPSGSITNVTALNNLVRYADWSQRPGNWEGGLLYSDIRHAVFANNTITLGTTHPLRVRLCPAGSLPDPPIPQLCPPHPLPAPVAPSTLAYPPCLNTLLAGYRRAWAQQPRPLRRPPAHPLPQLRRRWPRPPATIRAANSLEHFK